MAVICVPAVKYDYISQIFILKGKQRMELSGRPPLSHRPRHPVWPLGRAKARFSEVVRLARSGQPQQVTVHGKDAVVIVATGQFEHLVAHDVSPSLHRLLSESPLGRVPRTSAASNRFREVD